MPRLGGMVVVFWAEVRVRRAKEVRRIERLWGVRFWGAILCEGSAICS